MKRKKISKFLGLVGATCLCAGMFFCPATALPAQAAIPNPDVASPNSEIIEWRYRIDEDGSFWKRLYNYSRAEWEGEWIYVGQYPGKGKREP